MSDSPDHLDPKEATEARLCAYLEGELPANERAEIEQHLAANPQHRKLLADLAQTRDWMRVLPRESAPGDLAESFQGHVERSMLLEDPDGRNMTIIRWPQLAMIAAIVVLTLGLGVTLVIILKGPGSRNLAFTPPTTAPSLSSANKMQPMSPQPAPDAVPTAAPLASARMHDALPLAVPPAIAPPSAPAIAAVPTVTDALPVPPKELTADDIKSQLISAGYHPTGDVKSVCFVVRTDAPASTVDQLQGFFTRHQLVLEQPASLSNKALAMANEQQLNNAVAAGKQVLNTTNHSALQEQTSVAANGANQNNAIQNANTEAAANAQRENALQPDQKIAPPGEVNINNAAKNAVAANTTQPIVIIPADRAPAIGVAGGGGGGVAMPAAPPGTAISSDQQLYVAHNVSPLQLELLDASLAANNPNSSIRRITLSQGPPPATGLIVKGQTLIITIPQLVGPGMDKANVVKVSEDGTIVLPMLDTLPAAGATMDELQQRIVTRYHDANLISNATVTIATPPSTQPGIVMPAASTTMPMGLLPTTNPVAATTQPASGIDVVVVLQKSDATDKAK